MEIWPAVKRPLTDKLFGYVGRVTSLVLVRQRNNHRLVPALGLEDVHTVEAQSTLVRQRLNCREAGKSGSTEVDAIQ